MVRDRYHGEARMIHEAQKWFNEREAQKHVNAARAARRRKRVYRFYWSHTEEHAVARIIAAQILQAAQDEREEPRREIIYSAMPDKLLRAAFMLTWKAGASWKYDRNTCIQNALKAVDLTRELYPAARIKKPIPSQAEKLEYLGMLVDRINKAEEFKSRHQYGALKAILSTQKTGDIAHLGIAGMNLYGWAGEQ